MPATSVHRSHGIAEARRAVRLALQVLAGAAAHACSLGAQAGVADPHVIAPQAQAARDSERTEVLRQELKSSRAQLESLARRKAERLAAHDLEAATEAEAQRIRTVADIAALQREIAWTSGARAESRKNRDPAATATRNPPASGSDRASPPWWDVYRNGRRNRSQGPQDLPTAGEDTRPATEDTTGANP